MEIKNISFIEVKPPGLHIFSKYPIPRLGSVLLSTILKERGYKVRVFIEDISEPDWSYVENCDLVCISTITSTSIRAYKVADRLKNLGIPVVMGGAHPSFMAEESLLHADYVVRGEGDHAITELIDYLEKGTPELKDIQGLSYRDGEGGFLHTPDRPLLQDLDSLPAPDFGLVHNWKSTSIFPISTSRGCPFNCKFCSVIQMFGRQYRFKSVDTVMSELCQVEKYSKKSAFFVDDNFTANKRRTKELLRAMIPAKLPFTWSAQVRTDVAKDKELLRLMHDAGCDIVHIGFESINPATLEAFNKKQNLEEIVRCIKTVKDAGIQIHGMFVIGADTDTVDTIKKTADFARNLGIDTVQFMMLTPLPGTPFYFEMKEAGRLLHTDWSKYDAHHVVFKPHLMKPQTLQIETLKAMGSFYSWKYIFRHLTRLDFFHVAVGMYGKNAVKRALAETFDYFNNVNKPVDSHSLPKQI